MKRRIIQTFIVLCFGSILCVAPLGANNNLEPNKQTETLLTVNTEQIMETEISIEQNANSIVSTGNDIQQNEILFQKKSLKRSKESMHWSAKIQWNGLKNTKKSKMNIQNG